MKSVKLEINKPLTLTLLNPEGELDGRYEQVHYATDQGTLTLSYRTAAKLNILELKSGEQFQITKHQREHGTEYTVNLAPATEKARAGEEDSDLARQLAESIEASQKRAAKIQQNGNAKPKPTLPPSAIPYRQALAHITSTVTGVLNQAGEQWTADAKQDLISTVLIAAAKSKQITFDFTDGGTV